MMEKLTPMARSRVTFVALTMAFYAAAVMAQSSRSVWDGVYTADQAKKGEALVATQCVTCHGDGLRGGDIAPALSGDVFNSTWDGVTLSELADRIRTTMPFDNPGSLSRQQVSDILAYVLSLSKMPTGSAALPEDGAALGQIKYSGSPPQK